MHALPMLCPLPVTRIHHVLAPLAAQLASFPDRDRHHVTRVTGLACLLLAHTCSGGISEFKVVGAQDAQVAGLQIGDCLGLWGDSEAPASGNAADASRSRIPGAARGAAAEPGLGSRCASASAWEGQLPEGL